MSDLLKKPDGHDLKVRYEIVRARKERVCDGYHCLSIIPAGCAYLIVTEYPGGESGYATSAGHPVRLRICSDCAPDWTHWAEVTS